MMNNQEVIVEVRELTRSFQLGDNQVTALRGINLIVHAGEFVAIRGRSGSGKTTLLNLIGGLDYPDDGKVFIKGREITNLSETEMVALRRNDVSFVFQSFGLLPQFSAYETVEFTLRLKGLSKQKRHERTIECLNMVGLEERMNHRPDELSGGQQQRLCIARAIAINPVLILADEPTGELDSQTGKDILSLFRQIAALENTALIVASHDPLVQDFSTQVYYLNDGKLEIVLPDAPFTH